MPRYEDVLNKATELYAVMDALISHYYAVHREADAQVVVTAKLAVQKYLEVPTVLIREPQVIQILPPVEMKLVDVPPVPKPAPTVEWIPEPAPLPNNGSKLAVHEVVSKPGKPQAAPAKRSHRRK